MPNHLFNYEIRFKKTFNLIEEEELDYILITNLQNLYWLTGTAQYGVLLLSKTGESNLFIRRNFFRAQKESVLKDVIELKKTSQIVEYLKKDHPSLENLRIGMELDTLPASYFLSYQSMLKGVEIVNIEIKLRRLRMIKDSAELEIMRQAGKVAEKSQEVIPQILKPGIRENEVAAEVMHASMKNGSMHFTIVNGYLKNWFILASGKNLWVPSTFPILSGSGTSNAVPYCYSDRRLVKGDIVMCDYAVLYQGYHADHARTYFVETYPENFKERYLLLKNTYLDVANEYLRAGNSIKLIHEKIKAILDEKNLGTYFQGDGYYYQGLGHGLGLELDEPPYILANNEEILEENMVISLEPKIIIPNWGAIDLEDNFIIKKGRPEQITNSPYLF